MITAAKSAIATVLVAVYLRVSSDKQVYDEEGGEKVSLSEQLADIRALCEAKGYEIYQVYEDAGYRGSTKNRPAFKRMLKDAGDGKFGVIICWKSDRLSRGTYPATAIMQISLITS